MLDSEDNSEGESERKSLQHRAAQVIEPLIPLDAQERVEQSFKQWNQIVREHIRTETALKLADGDNRLSLPVKVVEGFPLPLAELINRYGDQVLWRLILGQPKLGGMIGGLQYLLKEWPALNAWPKLPEVAKLGELSLRHSLQIAVELQKTVAAEQVRKELTGIHRDILGVYRFSSRQTSSIELFWMPIAMVAAMLDLRIEDLTVVVLAHELAHGYTHLGRDIDGIRWDDKGFAESELAVVEGMAQFYTHVVAERLGVRTPNIRLAYEQLLTLQSGPYLVHHEWIKKYGNQRGETIRFAMINARGRGSISYNEWTSMLDQTQSSLVSGDGTKKKSALFGE